MLRGHLPYRLRGLGLSMEAVFLGGSVSMDWNLRYIQDSLRLATGEGRLRPFPASGRRGTQAIIKPLCTKDRLV